MKYTKVDLKGTSVDVDVTEDGYFESMVEGSVLKAPTLAELKSKIAEAIRRKRKVHIPVAIWDRDRYGSNDDKGRLKIGAITGIHGGNNNLIVKWEGEKTPQQYHGWNNSDFVDPSHAREMAELNRAVNDAKKRLQEFMGKYSFDGREKVEEVFEKEGKPDDDQTEAGVPPGN